MNNRESFGSNLRQGSNSSSNQDPEFPISLLGMWRMSIEDSRFDAGSPLEHRMHIRIFSYSESGIILCNFIGLLSSGAAYSGHWTSSLDGVPRPEYLSLSGASPHSMVTFVQTDEREFTVRSEKDGRFDHAGTFTLSNDSEELRYQIEKAERTSGGLTFSYRRWHFRQ